MRQNKIHGFTLADQDWIGPLIFKKYADKDWIGFTFCGSGLDWDWKISQSAHLCRLDQGFSNFLLCNPILKKVFLCDPWWIA